MRVYLVQEVYQGIRYAISAFEDYDDARGAIDLAEQEHPDRIYTYDYLDVTLKKRQPLGGEGCICNLPNGLANHLNTECPHYVMVY